MSKKIKMVISASIIAMILSGSILAVVLAKKENGTQANIYSHNTHLIAVELNVDQTFVIRDGVIVDLETFELDNGTEYNIIVVSGGKIWVSHANCPNEHNRCDKHGKINKVGQWILCLPHVIYIEVK